MTALLTSFHINYSQITPKNFMSDMWCLSLKDIPMPRFYHRVISVDSLFYFWHLHCCTVLYSEQVSMCAGTGKIQVVAVYTIDQEPVRLYMALLKACPIA